MLLAQSSVSMYQQTIWLLESPRDPAFSQRRSGWGRVCVYVCVCCLKRWQTHRRIARKKEQPLVRVNNAVMVAHTRLMITDWG